MRISLVGASTLCVLLFSGCGAVFTGYKGELGKYDTSYTKSECQDKFVDEKIKSGDDIILWSELGGSLKRKCKDYKTSNTYFDKAELHYKTDVDLENFGAKGAKVVGATLTNDNALPYEGNVFEAIMVNTYKGMNFMTLGDNKNARVEFNRALDRQRRAKNKFSKEIKKKIKKIKKKSKSSGANNKKSEDFVMQKYSEGLFRDFKAYPDFVNPFTTYMSALFFMSTKDYIKSRDLLKESIAMDPKNKVLKEDFKLVNRKLRRRDRNAKYIWFIYENGKTLKKKEFRIDLPIFLISSRVLYTGIALPTLEEQNSSYNFLNINGKPTKVISDMDRVVKTEFKIKMPMVVTRAVIRTIAKTVAQAEISDRNVYAGIAMGIFNAVTNKADVRSWVSLPKNFQALRVKNKGKENVIKDDKGEVLTSVFVPKNKNAIVFISSSTNSFFVLDKILF